MTIWTGVCGCIGNFLSEPTGFVAGPGGRGYDSKQAMAFHNYCLFGTDGPGPTPGAERRLCNVTDGSNIAARVLDRRRLRTALMMTEFGATFAGPPGLAEIEEVARLAEEVTAASGPPISWAFWAWDSFKGQHDRDTPYWDAISRSFAPAVAGRIESIRGAGRLSRRFTLVRLVMRSVDPPPVVRQY